MLLYYTVQGSGEREQVIERSRFITHIAPAESREEAEAFFTMTRKKYRDATHNVPAFVIGEKQELQWGSDDGEPSGTSGAPMVQLMVNLGLTNVAVMVTRYFGGIKLGTGGLVRAYTSSAQIGLEAAGVARVEQLQCLRCRVDYSSFQKVQSRFPEREGKLTDLEYAEDVRFSFLTDETEKDGDKSLLTNLTQGKVQFTAEENRIVKIPDNSFFDKEKK